MRARCIPVGTSNPPHEVDCARRRSLVYRLARAAQRRRCACCAPPMRITGGAERGGGGGPGRPPPRGPPGENWGDRTLTPGLCATASPSIGPREANFFPYLSIQLTAFRGSFSGVGDHSLSSGSEQALTPLSPWGGLHARRFQRDVSILE